MPKSLRTSNFMLRIEFHGPGSWRTRIVGSVLAEAIARQFTVFGSIGCAPGLQLGRTS